MVNFANTKKRMFKTPRKNNHNSKRSYGEVMSSEGQRSVGAQWLTAKDNS